MISDGGIDGVDELTAVVTVVITIQDIEEKPQLDLSPSDASTIDQTSPTFFVVDQVSVKLFRESVTITDEDFGDSINRVLIRFLNRPNGVQEGLRVGSVSLLSTSNVFTIPLIGIVDISGELANIQYFNLLPSPDTETRSLEISAVDSTGQVSQVANLEIELLTIPTFTMPEYTVFVEENSLMSDVRMVEAVLFDVLYRDHHCHYSCQLVDTVYPTITDHYLTNSNTIIHYKYIYVRRSYSRQTGS